MQPAGPGVLLRAGAHPPRLSSGVKLMAGGPGALNLRTPSIPTRNLAQQGNHFCSDGRSSGQRGGAKRSFPNTVRTRREFQVVARARHDPVEGDGSPEATGPRGDDGSDTDSGPSSSQTVAFGGGKELPTQADMVSAGVQLEGDTMVQVVEKKGSDIDYLQELIAIQQSGPKILGFFGTRNMGFMHQQLIEILSYAMVLTENHIITSGATGTNAAVIRGALRAEKPDLLTVVLPQSLSKQPAESQDLLKEVENVIQMPANDSLPLGEASRICNRDILQRVQHVICFAFHDSRLLLETCREGKEMRKIVTLFYLD